MTLAVAVVIAFILHVVHTVHGSSKSNLQPLIITAGDCNHRPYSNKCGLETARNSSAGGDKNDPVGLNATHVELQYPDPDKERDAQFTRRKPTVAIVSSCVASKHFSEELIRLSQLNKQQYCDAHDDVFCFLYNATMDVKFSSKWNKYPLVARSLEFHDLVIWMDCDTVFTNISLTLREIGLFRVKKDLVLTSDHNGINTGVFVVKRSEWSHDFLSLVYAQRVSVDYFNSKGKGSGFVDQQGLHILREKFFSKDEFDNHTVLSAAFTRNLNSYCTSGGLIHHRVNCNSEECDNYMICLIKHLLRGNKDLGGASCRTPHHIQSLCRKQVECCQDV